MEITQIGLRVTESRNESLDKRAARMGVTKNALINFLIELGEKVLDGTSTIAVLPKE